MKYTIFVLSHNTYDNNAQKRLPRALISIDDYVSTHPELHGVISAPDQKCFHSEKQAFDWYKLYVQKTNEDRNNWNKNKNQMQNSIHVSIPSEFFIMKTLEVAS